MSLDWASLDKDLVDLIGWRVLAGDLQDYVNFRAVCHHWNASTVGPRGRGILDPRFHPRHWMMLPEGHGLYPGVHLPLLDDHAILDSIDGLLVLHRDYDTAVRLLHPFTGDVGRITVMLAFDLLHRVAYATAGDQRWTFFTWKIQPLIKPVAFQGKLYAMEFLGKAIQKVCIYQIDPPHLDDAGELSHLPFPVKIAECPMDKLLLHPQLCRMLLGALASCLQCYSCSKLLVYRLADLVSGTIEPVRSIGNHALFMDERCLCFSLSPNKGSTNLSSLSPNSIICLHRVCLDCRKKHCSIRKTL
ncbi:hypothetical protein HU200_048212 [Digitaria exilis]|uniref:Uncharacterized protein n=1 Tax=Digitaria exilis TaxID=1010633 RepID=A0A835AVH5_9POAL|nr:hypothetical protein HU200_048212 [Digitaria exilis]